jgi:hypothetical protein
MARCLGHSPWVKRVDIEAFRPQVGCYTLRCTHEDTIQLLIDGELYLLGAWQVLFLSRGDPQLEFCDTSQQTVLTEHGNKDKVAF